MKKLLSEDEILSRARRFYSRSPDGQYDEDVEYYIDRLIACEALLMEWYEDMKGDYVEDVWGRDYRDIEDYFDIPYEERAYYSRYLMDKQKE